MSSPFPPTVVLQLGWLVQALRGVAHIVSVLCDLSQSVNLLHIATACFQCQGHDNLFMLSGLTKVFTISIDYYHWIPYSQMYLFVFKTFTDSNFRRVQEFPKWNLEKKEDKQKRNQKKRETAWLNKTSCTVWRETASNLETQTCTLKHYILYSTIPLCSQIQCLKGDPISFRVCSEVRWGNDDWRILVNSRVT